MLLSKAELAVGPHGLAIDTENRKIFFLRNLKKTNFKKSLVSRKTSHFAKKALEKLNCSLFLEKSLTLTLNELSPSTVFKVFLDILFRNNGLLVEIYNLDFSN